MKQATNLGDESVFDRDSLIELVSIAEYYREKGNTDLAKELLEKIVLVSKEMSTHDITASALGHLIVCYKHDYRATGNTAKIKTMQQLCREGLALDVTEQNKKEFHLRLGDCHMAYERYQQAVESYSLAYLLCAPNSGESAEYLGHLAEAKLCVGNSTEAADDITRAIKLLTYNRSQYRRFHYLTVKSGLYFTQTKIALNGSKTIPLLGSALQAFGLSLWLWLRHGNPLRFRQCLQALSFSRD